MQKDRRKDNRGMTLLEVIIAVSIFSIAAIILMQGFVTSGRINKKSNLYLEATSTAQNVMEEIKAKSFEKTALAFNYPFDPTYSEGGFSRFHFLEQDAWDGLINPADGKGTMIMEGLPTGENGKLEPVKALGKDEKIEDVLGKPEYATVLYDENKGEFVLNPRTKDKTNKYYSKYFFQMLNVTNRKETFDILVTIDGSKDSGYKSPAGTAEEDAVEKNDFEMPNIAKLDKKTNGFLAMNPVWDEAGLAQIIDRQFTTAHAKWEAERNKWYEEQKNRVDSEGKPIPPELYEPFPYEAKEPKKLNDRDTYVQMKRTLTVKLEQNGDASAIVKYWSELDASEVVIADEYAPFTACTHGTDCYCRAVSAEFSPYPTADTGNADLKNMYVFYYPNYESKAGKVLDTIQFLNESNYPVDFYLVKMKDPEIADGNALKNSEESYRMNLEVVENPNDNWLNNQDIFRTVTRLRTNLDYNISNEKVIERTKNSQMNPAFKDGIDGQSTSGSTAKKNLSCNGLEDRQQKDRIYKVNVGVYKRGAAEKGFQPEDLIASLEGSKED